MNATAELDVLDRGLAMRIHVMKFEKASLGAAATVVPHERAPTTVFQPDSPFHGLEGLKHMESAIVPAIYDPGLADEDLRVSSERAYEMVRRLAREEGLLAGISSGAALAVMLDVARRIDRGVIVTIFPDGAEKYLTEKFWTADV